MHLSQTLIITRGGETIESKQVSSCQDSRLTVDSVRQPLRHTLNLKTRANNDDDNNNAATTIMTHDAATESMRVTFVELENKYGTRGHLADGENATIQSLKEFIFPGRRNLDRVPVYTPPPAITGSAEWIRKSPAGLLVQNTLYGYIDLRAEPPQPQQNGCLRNFHLMPYIS
jgi:hypothetical protein